MQRRVHNETRYQCFILTFATAISFHTKQVFFLYTITLYANQCIKYSYTLNKPNDNIHLCENVSNKCNELQFDTDSLQGSDIDERHKI